MFFHSTVHAFTDKIAWCTTYSRWKANHIRLQACTEIRWQLKSSIRTVYLIKSMTVSVSMSSDIFHTHIHTFTTSPSPKPHITHKYTKDLSASVQAIHNPKKRWKKTCKKRSWTYQKNTTKYYILNKKNVKAYK